MRVLIGAALLCAVSPLAVFAIDGDGQLPSPHDCSADHSSPLTLEVERATVGRALRITAHLRSSTELETVTLQLRGPDGTVTPLGDATPSFLARGASRTVTALVPPPALPTGPRAGLLAHVEAVAEVDLGHPTLERIGTSRSIRLTAGPLASSATPASSPRGPILEVPRQKGAAR